MRQPSALPEVFVLTAELATKRGARSIKDLPGCFEMQIDERWWVAINGHGRAMKCSKDAEVASFGMYFERDGWPCGLVDAGGGAIAGEGKEDELVAALRAAIEGVVVG